VGRIPISDGGAVGDRLAAHRPDLLDNGLRGANLFPLAGLIAAKIVDNNPGAFARGFKSDAATDAPSPPVTRTTLSSSIPAIVSSRIGRPR
jgi:hypothetical protein